MQRDQVIVNNDKIQKMKRVFQKTFWVCVIFAVTLLYCPGFSMAIDTSIDAFNASGAMNKVMEDNDFTATGSMNEAQIQNFLVANNSYLKDYQENGKSAARIIYEASHGLSDASIGSAKGITITSETGTISPKVILVFLQKEQSLVTKTDRDDYALTYAMGYDCPDSTGCSGSNHPGFAEQVGWGAWQLRYNFEAAKLGADWWNQKYPGSDSICYVGQTKSIHSWDGDRTVAFQNAATASVYRYTPHVFDSTYNIWQFFYGWTWPAGGNSPAPAPVVKPVKPGDINLDDTVDILDLSIFSNNWGQTGPENKSDLNSDGIVDIQDLSILASNWGK